MQKKTAHTPLMRTIQQAMQTAATPSITAHSAPYSSSRRDFLRQTGLLGLGVAAAGLDPFGLWNRPKKANIAIIGAGIAGLSAAYYLRKRGIQATIFEGDKRVAGRIKSIQQFGNNQLTTELGAEFIDTDHTVMRGYADAFGFPLLDVTLDKSGEKEVFFIEGQKRKVKDIIAEFEPLLPILRKDQAALGAQYQTARAKALDAMPLAEYLESLPASRWLKTLLHSAYLAENGLETYDQSTLNMLTTVGTKPNAFAPYGVSDERFKVIGGNDQIPRKLGEIMADQIRFEHRLVSVRREKGSAVQLTFDQGNGAPLIEQKFDAVILALPFSTLRGVELAVEMSDRKRRCIEQLAYGHNVKVIQEFKTRPWRTHGEQGYLFGDVVPNAWDSSHQQLQNAGMGTYTSFLGGNDALKANAERLPELQTQYLRHYEQVFQGMTSAATGQAKIAAWPSNPWSRGSYSSFGPGQYVEFDGIAAQPLERIYFAGEHCSSAFWGFMEGAARTGQEAAKQVVRVLQLGNATRE